MRAANDEPTNAATSVSDATRAAEEFPIRVEQRGHVAIWTLDREERRNALSRAALLAFGSLAREAESNASIRAVVITGAGKTAFCAGADLKERRTMNDDDVRAQLQLYRSELGAIDRLGKPVIAAINGVALGGGLELALACDLRVAAAHAVVALPETSLAIVPGAGGTQRLPRVLGEARAKELILLGTRLDAQAALAWGLVNRVVPAGEDLLEATLAWLTPILEGGPLAMRSALRAIDAAADHTLEEGLRIETECYETVLRSHDRREALVAFAEKRKPVYRGE